MTARRRRTASTSGRKTGRKGSGGRGGSGAGKEGRARRGSGSGTRGGGAAGKGRAPRSESTPRAGRRAGAGASEATRRPRAVVGCIPVEIGRVVHVYPRAGAAVVALTGELRAGDAVAVRGATTDFCALAERLERDGEPVAEASAGESVGVALPHRVREGDRVFRLSR